MRRIPSLWVRLTALAVFLGVLLVAMIGLTYKVIRPYREAGVESRRLADTRRLVLEYQRRNAVLRRQIASLNTPDGIISAGHGMGYFRPGEIPLVIEAVPTAPAADTPAADTPAESAPADAAPGTAPLLVRRFWHHLRDL